MARPHYLIISRFYGVHYGAVLMLSEFADRGDSTPRDEREAVLLHQFDTLPYERFMAVWQDVCTAARHAYEVRAGLADPWSSEPDLVAK